MYWSGSLESAREGDLERACAKREKQSAIESGRAKRRNYEESTCELTSRFFDDPRNRFLFRGTTSEEPARSAHPVAPPVPFFFTAGHEQLRGCCSCRSGSVSRRQSVALLGAGRDARRGAPLDGGGFALPPDPGARAAPLGAPSPDETRVRLLPAELGEKKRLRLREEREKENAQPFDCRCRAVLRPSLSRP